jgi:hypothetical protein
VSAGSNPAGGTRTRADSLTQPGGTVHPAGCHPLPGCDSRRHVLTPSAPHTLPKMLSRCRQAPRAGACKSRWASPRPRRPAYCLQHCRTWPFLGSSGAAARRRGPALGSALGGPAGAGPTPQRAADQPGSFVTQAAACPEPQPRRTIVQLAATAPAGVAPAGKTSRAGRTVSWHGRSPWSWSLASACRWLPGGSRAGCRHPGR